MVFRWWQKLYELILALVSLWLLANSIKKKMPKKNVRLIFFIILFKDIFYYYIIILPLFGFKRGYGVKDRLDFTQT